MDANPLPIVAVDWLRFRLNLEVLGTDPLGNLHCITPALTLEQARELLSKLNSAVQEMDCAETRCTIPQQ